MIEDKVQKAMKILNPLSFEEQKELMPEVIELFNPILPILVESAGPELKFYLQKIEASESLQIALIGRAIVSLGKICQDETLRQAVDRLFRKDPRMESMKYPKRAKETREDAQRNLFLLKGIPLIQNLVKSHNRYKIFYYFMVAYLTSLVHDSVVSASVLRKIFNDSDNMATKSLMQEYHYMVERLKDAGGMANADDKRNFGTSGDMDYSFFSKEYEDLEKEIKQKPTSTITIEKEKKIGGEKKEGEEEKKEKEWQKGFQQKLSELELNLFMHVVSEVPTFSDLRNFVEKYEKKWKESLENEIPISKVVGHGELDAFRISWENAGKNLAGWENGLKEVKEKKEVFKKQYKFIPPSEYQKWQAFEKSEDSMDKQSKELNSLYEKAGEILAKLEDLEEKESKGPSTGEPEPKPAPTPKKKFEKLDFSKDTATHIEEMKNMPIPEGKTPEEIEEHKRAMSIFERASDAVSLLGEILGYPRDK